MSKMKKLLALMMTVIMVMAMGMTSFAAPKKEATITVNNADKAAMFYVQAIKPDPTTKTGWAFTNDKIAKAYTDAFGLGVDESQKAIERLISLQKIEDNGIAENVGDISTQIANALQNVIKLSTELDWKPMAKPQTVNSAGVYVILAGEQGYTYNPMAAYVGFGEVEGNEYPSLMDATVEAKKEKNDIEKSAEDEDKVVEIGRTEVFHVTSEVPFYSANATNREYWFEDQISGADYVTDEGGVVLSVKVGSTMYGDFRGTLAPDGKSFTVDLSSLIANNANANLPIDITYGVVVKDIQVHNDAMMGDAEHKDNFGKDSEDLYTGSIKLTKYNENESEKLAGAGFEVYDYTSKNNVPTDGKLLKFDDLGNGVYRYNPDGEITEVFTNKDGVLTVKGLDEGNYFFKETTAPEGYSINANGTDAELKLTDAEQATEIITTTTSINDTKLSALPGTGGIGTTIFTIGGCVIMIAAAALFFASRKKEQK